MKVILSGNELCYATRDLNPVMSYRTRILPLRHLLDLLGLYQTEISPVQASLWKTHKEIEGLGEPVTREGNVGVNSGGFVELYIPHCHIPLIPRRKDSPPRNEVSSRCLL